MLNSNSLLMLIAGLHFSVWLLTMFFSAITGSSSDCTVARVFCDTPVETFILSSSLPDLGLLGIITLVPNLVTSGWALLSFDYGLLKSDGVSGILYWILRLGGAVVGLVTAWGAVSALLNAYRR